MRLPLFRTLAVATVLFQSPAFAAQHLQFVDHDKVLITDVGPKGDSPGDIMSFTGVFTTVDSDKPLGYEQGLCIRIDTKTKSWECSFSVKLADGSITVQGPYADVGDSHMIVTGGTGAYLGAKGTLLVQLRPTKPMTGLLTFDLE